MLELGIRRQLVIALVASIVMGFTLGNFAFFFIPVAFVWSTFAYRVAAGLLAALMTWAAVVLATGFGLPSFVSHQTSLLPVAAVSWLAVWPIRRTPTGKPSDGWNFAGRWPASETRSAKREDRRQERIRRLAAQAVPVAPHRD